jgi:divalent metal cation (Fe/Co/Zn/Cd) transporter
MYCLTYDGTKMKYWNELRNVENELIKIDTIVSLVRSLNYAMEAGVETSDVKNCLWKIEEEIDSVSRNSNVHFQELWDVVREDTHKEFDGSLASLTSEKVADELEKVVNSWVKE